MNSYKFSPLESISGKDMAACLSNLPMNDERWEKLPERLRKHFKVTPGLVAEQVFEKLPAVTKERPADLLTSVPVSLPIKTRKTRKAKKK